MNPVHDSTRPASRAPAPTRWVKADLHLHTDEDPFDEIDYTALELLDHAKALGFNVLAITLHDKVFDDERVFARARALGILLIQAAEMRIEGADVVLLNLSPAEAAGLLTFDDLRRLRAQRGDSLLTFAPHPYYRLGGSIGDRLEQCLDCFDAIEHCHFHVPVFDPNARAARVAKKHGIPLLATSDAHRRIFFGQNYSLLGLDGTGEAGAPPMLEEVFAAIRAGRIERVSPTGGVPRFLALLIFLFCVHPILVRLPGAKRVQARKRRQSSTRLDRPPAANPDAAPPQTLLSP
jgi:hypothetical protein